MPRDRSPDALLVRTTELDRSEELHVGHPLNPRSEIFMTRLSDRAGLTHLGVSLARLPPGKESFALHVHAVQEEWIYVLAGEGQVQLGDATRTIRPGDFVGFPANGPAHLVRNCASEDLVYLQGGDRRPGDRTHFPELRLVTWEQGDGHVALVPDDQIALRPFSDWARD